MKSSEQDFNTRTRINKKTITMKKKSSSKNTRAKKTIQRNVHQKKDTYKDALLAVDSQEEKYNKLFDQKINEQYRTFQTLKDQAQHHKRFNQIIAVIIALILIVLLLLSFS